MSPNGPSNPSGKDESDVFGGRRSRIQQRLKSTLEDIPSTDVVQYVESGTGMEKELRADLDIRIFADAIVPTETAYVVLNWWPQRQGEADWFKIHYADSEGFDCGWHRQPNNHVDQLLHYQERASTRDEYQYESVNLSQDSPVGIVWEIVDGRLPQRVQAHYEDEHSEGIS